MKKIIKALKNPLLVVIFLCKYWPFRLISDKTYVKLFYRAYTEKKLNLQNPITFNEKLQWLKLYDRNAKYTEMTDKYSVRNFIERTIGKEYLVPLIDVWDTANDIDFEKLPEKFVLKCNHDSGSIVVCTDKNKLNRQKAIKKLKKGINFNYFWKGREYNYYHINRKIVAEKYLEDSADKGLTDYKFFCFDGEPKFIQVDSARFTDHVRNFYTTDWEFMDVQYGCKNDRNCILDKPKDLDKMLELAKVLSQGIPHVRVDFYYVDEKIYFGEMTFHHGGGVMDITPKKYDKIWGDYLNLNNL